MLALIWALLIAIVIAGLLYWLIKFLPLDEPFRQLARGVIIIGLVAYIIVRLWAVRGLVPT